MTDEFSDWTNLGEQEPESAADIIRLYADARQLMTSGSGEPSLLHTYVVDCGPFTVRLTEDDENVITWDEMGLTLIGDDRATMIAVTSEDGACYLTTPKDVMREDVVPVTEANRTRTMDNLRNEMRRVLKRQSAASALDAKAYYVMHPRLPNLPGPIMAYVVEILARRRISRYERLVSRMGQNLATIINDLYDASSYSQRPMTESEGQ